MSRIRSIAVKIALLALIVSLVLTAYYYVSLRRENERVLNNIRSIALAVYGYEISGAAYFLEIYAKTWNSSALAIARHDIAAALRQSKLCLQGLPDDPASMYTILRDTTNSLDIKFVYLPEEAYNATKIMAAVQLLREIASAFGGMEIIGVDGIDPLERLGQSRVNSVIDKCKQISNIINW